jgi:hypothetical protein
LSFGSSAILWARSKGYTDFQTQYTTNT